MNWVQRGGVMVNMKAAKRMEFLPHGVDGKPGPTLTIFFDGLNNFSLHGPSAARAWFEMERDATRSRTRPGGVEGQAMGALLQQIPISTRDPKVDEALKLFDVHAEDGPEEVAVLGEELVERRRRVRAVLAKTLGKQGENSPPSEPRRTINVDPRPRIEPDPQAPTKAAIDAINVTMARFASSNLNSDAKAAPNPAADRTSDTFVRAKVSTPIPSGTFKSPSSSGFAQITHWVNCAWMSEMSSVQVWNDNTLTAPIPVGTVVKLGRLGDQWWLLAASCTPEAEEPAVDPIPSFHGSPRPGRESRWPDVRFLVARDLKKFLWEVDQLPPQEREAWEIYYASMGRLGC